jgi:hypothetical protein
VSDPAGRAWGRLRAPRAGSLTPRLLLPHRGPGMKGRHTTPPFSIDTRRGNISMHKRLQHLSSGAVESGHSRIDVRRKVGGIQRRFGAVSPSSAPSARAGWSQATSTRERKATVQVTEFEGFYAACGRGLEGPIRAPRAPGRCSASGLGESLKRGDENASWPWKKRFAQVRRRAAADLPEDDRSSSIALAGSDVNSWFQTTCFGR